MARIDPAVVELQRPQEFGFQTGIPTKGRAGQWLCRCISTGQDDSTEVKMTQIGTTVLKLQRPQEFGCSTGIPSLWWLTDQWHAVVHLRANAVSYNLRWRNSVQQLWSYSVRKVDGWTDGRRTTDGRTDGLGLFYNYPFRPLERRGTKQSAIKYIVIHICKSNHLNPNSNIHTSSVAFICFSVNSFTSRNLS